MNIYSTKKLIILVDKAIVKVVLVILPEADGAILDAASAIAKVLGPARVATPDTLPTDITMFDLAILCIDGSRYTSRSNERVTR
jgi:hypothetical protein